jgi:hypothetical protein
MFDLYYSLIAVLVNIQLPAHNDSIPMKGRNIIHHESVITKGDFRTYFRNIVSAPDLTFI